jgi:hypothetical protein
MKELVTFVKVVCHGVRRHLSIFRRMENKNMVMAKHFDESDRKHKMP